MKLTSYREQAWEASGYWASIPRGGVPVGSVIPNVIYRSGTTPVFGLGQVSEMSIPVEFGYRGALSYEQAWIQLMKWLRPLDPTVAVLIGTLNDGTVVKTDAIITVPSQADEEINTLTVVFVSVQPFFSGNTRSTASQVFA